MAGVTATPGAPNVGQTILEPVSVDGPESIAGDVTVYPNPARDFMTIEGAGKAMLYDVMGRHLQDVEVDGAARLDLSALAPGVYFLRLGERTRSFIKQ